MRKYKKYTREEYSKKFDDLMENTFNYVMQEGEQIVQCKEPYPAYWFMSNKGYLFSAYGSKIKVVKSNHRYTGTKNKDGSRTGQDWYYEYKVAGQKHNKHVTMYRVMSDCFCENEFGSEDNEIHHIRKKNQYKPSEGKECNRAENLQLLPREIHKNLTYYASKPDAEHNKELEEKIKNADCPSFQFPQEQFQDLLMAALYDCNVSGGKAIMYTTTNNRQCGGYRSRSACFGRRKDTETEPGRMRIIIYEGRTKQM